MAIGFLKNKKGQVSIEFILIVLIALIYIYAVIQPTVDLATKSTDDTTRLSQTKLAAQKLAASINQVEASQSDGKKTISLLIPRNSEVSCAGTTISFSTKLSNPLKCGDSSGISCPQGCSRLSDTEIACTGQVNLLAGSSIVCDFGGTSTITASSANLLKEITVLKTGTSITVVD